MNKNILNSIDEIEDMATGVEISCSKAKTVIDYVVDFFLNEEPIVYRHKEMGNLSEIVRDYILELGETIDKLQKLIEQLHDEYTKNSLSKG